MGGKLSLLLFCLQGQPGHGAPGVGRGQFSILLKDTSLYRMNTLEIKQRPFCWGYMAHFGNTCQAFVIIFLSHEKLKTRDANPKYCYRVQFWHILMDLCGLK